jgi:tRNA(adenine34) deaminase
MNGMPAISPEQLMKKALVLASEAALEGEVPVGALVSLPDGRCFEGRNRIQERSVLDHAEMEAMNKALSAVGRHGLGNATLYCTAEPCLMCLGAMVQARIGGLVYGCEEPRFGGVALLRELWAEGRYPHRFPIASGICKDEARRLLVDFFKERR